MNLPTIPILMVIILCLLLFKIYIAFRSPFWSKQPVQHWFGQWQYLFSYPHVIRQGVRPMDRHVSLNQITTQKMSELSDNQLHHQISILQEHYLNESGSVYRATKNILLPYFIPLQDGLVSFYFPPAPATSAPTPVGIITSRKLELIRSSSGPVFAVYYVDYLCVHKEYRNQGIASQLIATHEYHQSRQLPYCPISLFKREEVLLPGVVPLCRYQTFTYVLNLNHTTTSAAQQDQIKAVRIGTSNAPLVWKPMLEDHLGGFSVQLLANWDCLMELLRTENIYVYLIRQRTAAATAAAAYRDVGCLFFRKTGVHVARMGQQLTCFGSIWTRKAKGEGVEIAGLEASLLDILNNTAEPKGENYALLSIENISHNYRILPLPPSSFWSTTPIASRPTAYYFYNYVHPTLSSKQVLFLG